MTQYKELLLNTMKFLIALCEKHGIQYVATAGTVLGAVRHKGVIPWDDDIDIVMTRENYDKFLNLRNSPDLGHYEIMDVCNDGYYLPYAKFCDARTTIWEVKTYPFVMGVFIDIFPIDEVSLDESESISLRSCYKKFFTQYQLSLRHYDLRCLRSIRNIKSCVKSFLYSERKTKEKLFALESAIKKCKGEYGMWYGSDLPFSRAKMKRSWVEGGIEVPFEDFKIIIPEDYDGFLKQLYGDYMTPPPEEKRVSQHFHYFVDLDRRLSIEEIKKIKNGN